MLFLYGDSHARSFRKLTVEHKDYHQPSVTMFRIGRDNTIVNFDNTRHNENSILCMIYGEVDCRCHIQRQINLGRNEDDIIYELVDKYVQTIRNNATVYKHIILVGVIPTTNQHKLENIHGPITHEFPFVGSDDDRVRFTKKVNTLLESMCTKYGYIYFNPYSYYTTEEGTLNFELSDTCGHLANNTVFLEKFMELYNTIA